MKCILDTNVPVKASYAHTDYGDEELELIGACVDFIHGFMKNPDSKLVLDMEWEIINEYRRNMKQTPMGTQFMNWVNMYISRADFTKDIVKLERQEEGYDAFPNDIALDGFDLADRKFVALALSHNEKPPIIQAADGKWLEYVDKLKEYGIHIEFLDKSYAESKYNKKILGKRSK